MRELGLHGEWIPDEETDLNYIRLAEWFAWYHLPYCQDLLQVETSEEALLNPDLFKRILLLMIKQQQQDNEKAQRAHIKNQQQKNQQSGQ